MTTTVSSLVSKAGIIIQDTTNVRWPTTEFLTWLNDGQREVVLLRPSASVTNNAVALSGGETRQTLPTDGLLLIDVLRNMGSGGTSPGNAIRLCAREVLDAQVPTWHNDSNSLGYIQHFMYNPLDPKHYYVYPKAPATWYVQIAYSSIPTDASSGGNISIDDIYSNALVDYMLYRAYSKDSEYAGNAQAAVAHYTAFQNALAVKTQTEMQSNPNLQAKGFNPNVAGGAKI